MNINYNYIVSYSVFKKRSPELIWWQDYKKGSFFTKETKEGFYEWDVFESNYLGTTISRNNIFTEGKELFYKPHVEIYLTTKQRHTKYFDTEEELNNWIWSNLKQIKTLEI